MIATLLPLGHHVSTAWLPCGRRYALMLLKAAIALVLPFSTRRLRRLFSLIEAVGTCKHRGASNHEAPSICFLPS